MVHVPTQGIVLLVAALAALLAGHRRVPVAAPSRSRPPPSRPPPPSTGCSARGRSPTATPSPRTGAAIDYIEHGVLHVTATAGRGRARSAARLQARSRSPPPAPADGVDDARLPAGRLRLPQLRRDDRRDQPGRRRPPGDRPQAESSAPPTRAATSSLIKISDNVGTDETEPEILFNAHQHAREHLTVEMALYLLHLFTDGYGTDSRVTNMVNSREIWIVPDVNPDGGEYDIATGSLPVLAQEPPAQQPARPYVGTDLNRNWGYQWGCCGGSSGSTVVGDLPRPVGVLRAGDPAAARLRQQPGGRRRAADQGEHRLPHLLAAGALAVRLHHRQHRARPERRPAAARSRTLGQQMAATNGYTPEQSSDLYITDGTIIDWMWGTPRHLRVHLRDVPAARPAAAASTRPTR